MSDGARANAVPCEPPRRDGRREVTRQLDGCSFTCSVGGHSNGAAITRAGRGNQWSIAAVVEGYEPANGCDVHYASLTPRAHHFEYFLREKEAGLDVGLEGSSPVLYRLVQQWREESDTGVVDESVE